MTVARLEDVVAGSEQVFPVWRLALDGLQAWKQVFERGYEGLRGQGRGERLRAGADEAVMRASLVVVFLLASVGAASAECAWVLWMRVSACKKDVGEYEYHVMRAHLLQRRCETDKPTDFVAGEGSPGCKRVNHVCLPHTVDPRGPKTK